MTESLTIDNLDAETAARLRERALQHGRSVADEGREILRAAVGSASAQGFAERAAALRRATAGRRQTPSEVLLRESRDER